MPQTWQTNDEVARSELGTYVNEELDNILTIINDRFVVPLGIRYSSPVLTVNASTQQKVESNGSDSTQNSFKWRVPLLNNVGISIPDSTLNFSTGGTTGSFIEATVAIPTLTLGDYIQMGIEIQTDGYIHVAWGTPAALVGNTTVPSFAKSSFQISVITLKNNGVGTGWSNFITPIKSDIEIIQKGSSGGGAGDTYGVWEDLKDYLDELNYQYLDANIASLDSTSKLHGTSTMTYDVANLVFKSTAGSQTLISLNHLNNEFISQLIDIPSIALKLVYDINSFDTNPSVYVSRNGGSEYQQVSLTRLGLTDTYLTNHYFTTESSLTTLEEYALANADSAQDLTATGAGIKVGQQITASNNEYFQQVSVYINKVGSPVGRLFVSLIKDASGAPSELSDKTVISTIGVDISTLASGNNVVVLSMPGVIVSGTNYHLVFETDNTYKSVYSNGVTSIRVQLDSTSPTGSITNYERFNGTAWSNVTSSKIVYKFEGRVLDLRVKVISSMASKIKGYGVYFGNTYLGYSKPKNIEIFDIDTSANVTSLTITKFMPDPDLVTVYVPQRGQVFKPASGVFSLLGNTLSFINQFFYELPASTLRVIVEQKDGISYDNSDTNANLLATNHLGSPDSNFDRSVAGRGIYLKSPNGTLYEITIKNGGTGFDIYEITA